MVEQFDTQEARSYIMSCIHGKDTKPELLVRKALHARGYRFSVHSKKLPGSPDLVLAKYNAVIQVQGCFWHGHQDCYRYKPPKTRVEYWQQKIARNRARDERNKQALLVQGWRLMVVWECAILGKTMLNREILIELIENWILAGNDFVELRGNPA